MDVVEALGLPGPRRSVCRSNGGAHPPGLLVGLADLSTRVDHSNNWHWPMARYRRPGARPAVLRRVVSPDAPDPAGVGAIGRI